MKLFFLDLFQYNNYYNRQILEALRNDPGFDSDQCLRLLSHTVNVHRIWNQKIQNHRTLFGAWEMHTVQMVEQINSENFEDSIEIVETVPLDQPVNYSLSSGRKLTHSISEILFQIINHSTYHRGQLATEFRRRGCDPLLTDYIFYKMT